MPEAHMFERMLDKARLPNVCEIEKHIGKRATKYVKCIIGNLRNCCELKIELKFPFGNSYGWGYKISNKSKHLFYIFFEKRAITVTIQEKAIGTDVAKRMYEALSDEGKEHWKNRYPCGDGGGWIHYRLLNDENFLDVGRLVMMKIDKEIPWELYTRADRGQ